MDIGESFVYIIPLKRLYYGRRVNRAKRAVDLIRKFVSRHAKIEEKNILIMDDVNAYIWSRGIEKPPRRVKVLVSIKEAEEGSSEKIAIVRLAGKKVKIGKYESK
ncbi:MAG: 50S ribosomal protein L31e [Caldisphaeraceae archaeon]|nr:50S ribosomal protein L31e [Caldisphaeraceae archaeon]